MELSYEIVQHLTHYVEQKEPDTKDYFIYINLKEVK